MTTRRWFLAVSASLVTVAQLGCSVVGNRAKTEYTTVAASAYRDEAGAVAATERAARLFQRGRWDQAEQKLQEALIADVTYGPAHNNLGRVYYEQGKLYLAAWEFEYAMKLMPDHPEPLNNLGMVYEAAERLERAVHYYAMAYQVAPQNPLFIGNLARARLKQDEQALEVRGLLSDLLMYDTRPDWVAWAREQLAISKLPVASAAAHEVETLGDGETADVLPPGQVIARPDRADSKSLDPPGYSHESDSSPPLKSPEDGWGYFD